MSLSLAHLPVEILAQITDHLSGVVLLILLPMCGDSQLMAKMRAGGVVRLQFNLARVTQGVLDFIRTLYGLQTFILDVNLSNANVAHLIRSLNPNLLHFHKPSLAPWLSVLSLLGETDHDELLPHVVHPTKRCWKVYKTFPKLRSLALPFTSVDYQRQREEKLPPSFMLEFFCGLPASLTEFNVDFASASIYDLWQTLPPHLTRITETATQCSILSNSLLDSVRDMDYCLGELSAAIERGEKIDPVKSMETFSFPPHLTKLYLTSEQLNALPGYLDRLVFPPSLTEFHWDSNITIHPLTVFCALPDTITTFSTFLGYEQDRTPPSPPVDLRIRPKPLLTHLSWATPVSIDAEEWASLSTQLIRIVPNVQKATFHFAEDLPFRAEHFALLSPSGALLSLDTTLHEDCFSPRLDYTYPLHETMPNLHTLDIRSQPTPSNFSLFALPASLTCLRIDSISTAVLDLRPPALASLACNKLAIHDYETCFIPPKDWVPSVFPSPAEDWNDQVLRLDHIRCARNRSGASPALAILGAHALLIDRGEGAPRWPSTLTSLSIYLASWKTDNLTPELLPSLQKLDIRGVLPDSVQLGGFTSLEDLTLVAIASDHQGSFPPNLRSLRMVQGAFFPISFLPLPNTLESLNYSKLDPIAIQSLPRLTTLTTRYYDVKRWDMMPPSVTSVVLLDHYLPPNFAQDLVEAFPLLKEITISREVSVKLMSLDFLRTKGSVKLIGGIGDRMSEGGSFMLTLKHLECEKRSIMLDPDCNIATWLRWNTRRAYPFWKPVEYSNEVSVDGLTQTMILPYLSNSITELDFSSYDVALDHDFAPMLPRGLTKLVAPLLNAPQYCATLGLPEGLKTLDIDTTGFGLVAYHCLPRGITHLTLKNQKKLTAAYAATLPQGLVWLELSAINIPKDAMAILPPSLVALKLKKQQLSTRILSEIPAHIKHIEAELNLASSYNPQYIIDVALERGLHWLGPSKGIPSLVEHFGAEPAVKKLSEHRSASHSSN